VHTLARFLKTLSFLFGLGALVGSAFGSSVEVLQFPDLVDSSRQAPVIPERVRIFKRRQKAEPLSGARRVPIQVLAPESGGPYPVLIFSHGAGGSWDGHFALAKFLATQGYVSLCLEHTGSNTARLTSTLRIRKNLQDMIHDSNEVLTRPKDVAFAIDQASQWNGSHPKLKGRMDLSRVAVLGHSFGAYTVLAIAGARPALDWLEPKVEPGSGLGPDLSDRRVKCGVALSPQPPGEPFFIRESFGSLGIPVLGISGTQDTLSNGNPPTERREAFKLWPERAGRNFFIWITDASHLDFSDRTRSGEDVQRVVRAAALTFLDRCLKDKEGDLSEQALSTTLGGSVKKVEVLKK